MVELTGMAALAGYVFLMLAVGLGALWLGCLIYNKTGKAWAGCIVGGVAVIGAIVICLPALGSLWEVHCRTAQDFHACLEGG